MTGAAKDNRTGLEPIYLRRRLTVLVVLLGLIGIALYVLVGPASSAKRPDAGAAPASSATGPRPAAVRTGTVVPSTSGATRAGRSLATADPATTDRRVAPERAARPTAFPVGTVSVEVGAQTPAGPATLPVEVYYPALASAEGAPPDRARGPYPLVVFSQGFGQYPSSYVILLDAWARAGYVVAAPTYTHTDPGPGLWRPDIVNHPAELSGTITAVLKDSATPGGILSGLVQPAEVAAAGQSDGGDVSLASSVNTCCRDTRIKAAVILSGAEYSVFGGTYFKAGNPPMLVTQGDHDSAYLGNAPVCSTNLYNAASAPKYYIDLLGATHLPPYTQHNAWESVVAKASVDFLNGYLRHQRGAIAAMLRAGAAPGVATITSGQRVPSAGGTC